MGVIKIFQSDPCPLPWVYTHADPHLTHTTDFPVTAYGGTKSIVISTRTVMGGKNPFLGIAYIVVGGICIVLGALFTGMHFIKPRCVSIYFFFLTLWNLALES